VQELLHSCAVLIEAQNISLAGNAPGLLRVAKRRILKAVTEGAS
jgi:hypothetical protein